MTITEFANIRKIQSQTISKYIKRHQEQFPELKKKGRDYNYILLDAVASKDMFL